MSEATDLDPIDNFLLEAAKRLRALPAERRSRVLAEAENHLRERAADPAVEGQSSEQAMQLALSSFGSARSWTSSIVDAYYADSSTRPALRAVSAFAAMPLAGAALLTLALAAFSPAMWKHYANVHVPLCACLFGFGLLGTTATAFLGRKASTAKLLILTAIVTAATFTIGGLFGVPDQFGVPTARSYVQFEARGLTREMNSNQADLNRLKSGLTAFQSINSSAGTSAFAAWREPGGGYVVPVALAERSGNYVWAATAFKMPIPYSGIKERAVARRAYSREPEMTVPTLAAARQMWLQNAPDNIADDQRNVAADRKYLRGREYREYRQPEFNFAAARYVIECLPLSAVLLLILDWLAARFGRWAYRHRRQSALPA